MVLSPLMTQLCPCGINVCTRTKSNKEEGVHWCLSSAKPCSHNTPPSAPDGLDSITLTHRDAGIFPLLDCSLWFLGCCGGSTSFCGMNEYTHGYLPQGHPGLMNCSLGNTLSSLGCGLGETWMVRVFSLSPSALLGWR